MTIERALRLIAGAFVALSVLLGIYGDNRFLWFTLFVGLNLFQSAFTNSGDHAIMILRGNCELSSRNVFFRVSSAAVGCTIPLTSVARDTSVCSPVVAPSHR